MKNILKDELFEYSCGYKKLNAICVTMWSSLLTVEFIHFQFGFFFVLWCSTFWDEYVKILTIVDSAIYLSKIFSDLKNIHLSRLHTYIHPSLLPTAHYSNKHVKHLSRVKHFTEWSDKHRGFVPCPSGICSQVSHWNSHEIILTQSILSTLPPLYSSTGTSSL